jgi:hypothetical protein
LGAGLAEAFLAVTPGLAAGRASVVFWCLADFLADKGRLAVLAIFRLSALGVALALGAAFLGLLGFFAVRVEAIFLFELFFFELFGVLAAGRRGAALRAAGRREAAFCERAPFRAFAMGHS